MAIKYGREKLGEGIHYSTLINKRQKTNTIIINIVTELSAETASLNAVIPYVLEGSSEEYPTVTELNKKLSELYGAAIKASVPKIGDSQVLSIMASCINDRYAFDGEAVTEELTRVLTGCLMKPRLENGVFYEKDFELKKQELIDDIEAEINEKRSYAFKRANLNIYKDEPAANSVKGEKSAAEKITAETAYEQYKKLLKTAQIEVIFFGAEEIPECKKIIADAFASVERDYGGKQTSKRSALKPEVCRVTEQYDVAQSKMVMAFKTDCGNNVVMSLLSAIYGATPISKLFMNVREKLSLCYYCSSGYNKNKGVLYVDSGVEKDNIAKAEAEIINQLDAMKRGDFTDEEMENALKSRINSIKSVNDGTGITAWYFDENYLGSNLSPEDWIERLMKVTREDIIEAAKSLQLDTVYVLTGKESEG